MAARSAADHGGARQEGRRPCGADRKNRQGRVRSRQPERKRRGVDRDRLPLRQASVAERSQCVGLARRQPPGACNRLVTRSLTNKDLPTRDPVTSPPLPVPDRFARGQPSPKGWPHLFVWLALPVWNIRHARCFSQRNPQARARALKTFASLRAYADDSCESEL